LIKTSEQGDLEKLEKKVREELIIEIFYCLSLILEEEYWSKYFDNAANLDFDYALWEDLNEDDEF